VPVKKERERPKETRITHSKDKRKLIVANYLISIHPKKVSRNYIANHAKLRAQNDDEFKPIMNEMFAMKWVTKEELSDAAIPYDIYGITEEGRDAVNEAKKLVSENHPLANLEVFEDMLEI